MKRRRRAGMVGLATAGLMIGAAVAEVATFQQGVDGYTGTQDTSVWTWGDNGYGGTRISVGKSGGVFAGLITFDLSSLAGQYTEVNSITLRMMLQGGSAHVGNARKITLHRIVDGNGGWVQGVGTGGAATTGVATINWKAFQQTFWSGGGGSFINPGVQFDTNELASITVDHNQYGTAHDFVFTGDLTALVDTWSGNQGSNGGLAVYSDDLQSAGYVMHFDSSEQTNPPLLTVNYSLVAGEVVGSEIATAIEVYWDASNAVNYQVQYTDDLVTTNWLDLGPVIVGDGSTTGVFDSARGVTDRYYRVIR